MKLIDLLVQELPSRGGWPSGIGKISMHANGMIYFDGNRALGFNLPQCDDGWHGKLDYDYTNEVTREQYEAALAPSKQPEWNDDGRPPVGVTCEHCPGGTTQTEWEVVTVLGISNRPGGMFTDYWLRKEDGSSYIIGNPYRFRPICTEAERRREEYSAMIEALFYTESSDGNYLRGAGVYDAIADGKIPGIKLAD